MKYSIFNPNTQQRITLGKEIQNSYVDWEVYQSFHSIFEDYLKSYSIKNDIVIFDYSLFTFLCEKFSNKGFSLHLMNIQWLINCLKEEIYFKRLQYYEDIYIDNKLNEISPIEIDDLNDTENLDTCDGYKPSGISNPNIEETLSYETEIIKKISVSDKYQYCKELARKDSDIVNSIEDLLGMNSYLIFNEFKDFIESFHAHLIQLMSEDFSKFKTHYNILIKDMEFFKKTQINSLSRYKFAIGASSKKNKGSRGKIDDFIPAGICYYNNKIFINHNSESKKHGAIWFKRSIKHTFYHEIGHALDSLSFKESILKDCISREKNSHNKEFLEICKKNHYRFKFLKNYLHKKQINWLEYYINPIFIQSNKSVSNTENIHKKSYENIQKEFSSVFSDLLPQKQFVFQPLKEEKFSSKVFYKNKLVDFSKPLVESWAESFSFIFNWIKNGFSEYDKFILQNHKSSDRVLIKSQYESLLYILENFDWSKLNISYSFYLKRKIQIKKFLKHIKEMPVIYHKQPYSVVRRKKYLTYNDMIKKL